MIDLRVGRSLEGGAIHGNIWSDTTMIFRIILVTLHSYWAKWLRRVSRAERYKRHDVALAAYVADIGLSGMGSMWAMRCREHPNVGDPCRHNPLECY